MSWMFGRKSRILLVSIAALSFASPSLGASWGSSSHSSSSFSGRSYSSPSSRYSPGLGLSKPSAPPSDWRGGSSRTPSIDSGSHAPASDSSRFSPGLGLSKPSAPGVSGETNPSHPSVLAAPTSNYSPGLGLSKPNAPGLSSSNPMANRTPIGGSTSLTGRNTVEQSSSRQGFAASLRRMDSVKNPSSLPGSRIDLGSARRDPGYSAAASVWRHDPQTYVTQRQYGLDSWHRQYPNIMSIQHNIHPYYGHYDSGFLTGMFLGAALNPGYSNWLYANQYQPWYPELHADLMRQAQDNADLRAQLAATDEKLAEMKERGLTPQSASTLPSGVNPALAYAPEYVQQDASTYAPSSFWSWFWGITAVSLAGIVGYMLITRRRS
jgi:hypothetical protein